MMTNRELETRYNQMKATWKNLVNANVELVDENKILREETVQLKNRINNAKHFIDQVLGYHLSSGYEQLDKDANELYGILMGVDKE